MLRKKRILRYFIQNNKVITQWCCLLRITWIQGGKKKGARFFVPFAHPLLIHPQWYISPGHVVARYSVGRERLWPLSPVNYPVVHSSGFHVVGLQHTVNGDVSKVALLADNAALWCVEAQLPMSPASPDRSHHRCKFDFTHHNWTSESWMLPDCAYICTSFAVSVLIISWDFFCLFVLFCLLFRVKNIWKRL